MRTWLRERASECRQRRQPTPTAIKACRFPFPYSAVSAGGRQRIFALTLCSNKIFCGDDTSSGRIGRVLETAFVLSKSMKEFPRAASRTFDVQNLQLGPKYVSKSICSMQLTCCSFSTFCAGGNICVIGSFETFRFEGAFIFAILAP